MAIVIDLLLVLQKFLRSCPDSLVLLALPVAILGIAVLGWLGLAAIVKRCHDLGQSGFFALIPLYGLWLVFPDGTHAENKYGINPKAGPHAAREASGIPLAIAILLLSLGFWLSQALSK